MGTKKNQKMLHNIIKFEQFETIEVKAGYSASGDI
jgi:hypothetical protein